MKKFLGFIFALLLSLTISSCTNCSNVKDPVKPEVTYTTISTSAVESMIAMDRQAMYMKFKDNYRWYETCIRLPYFLDSDSVTSDPVLLVNIFQSIEEFDNGADTYVWKFQHFPDGTVLKDSVHGFWIEDCPLNEDTIKVNYKAAFDRMLQVNLPTPHSKNVILRNPIGPVGINAQWVFGNISEQIWVDAVTGECKSSNPAFPEEKGFKMPLGEWP